MNRISQREAIANLGKIVNSLYTNTSLSRYLYAVESFDTPTSFIQCLFESIKIQ